MSVNVTKRVVKRVSILTRMVEKRSVTDLKPGCKSAVFTGTLQDENIVPQITENFVADKTKIKYIKKASHNRGWEAAYNMIRAE